MSVEPQLLQIVMNGLQSNEYALSWNDDFDFNDDKPMHTISTNQYHYQHHQQQYNLKNHLSNHSHHTSPFPILIQIYFYCQIMCFLCFLHEQKQNTVSINIYVCINNMPAIFCQFFAPICIYISSYFDAHSDTHTHIPFVWRIVALLQRSKNYELPTILLKIKQRVNVTHATDFSSIIYWNRSFLISFIVITLCIINEQFPLAF